MLLVPSFLKHKTIPLVIGDKINQLKLSKYNFISQHIFITNSQVLITNPELEIDEKKNNSF